LLCPSHVNDKHTGNRALAVGRFHGRGHVAMNSWRICISFARASCALAALIVLMAGCNPEKVPRLGKVTGTVTLEGQPVADARVLFEGAQPGEPPSVGKTDASGNYELYYSRGHKGATIGDHAVYISTYEPATDDNPQVKKETIPTKYNGKSELKSTVKRGTNKMDFQLQAGEIVQPDQPDPKAKKKKGK
jgi:hypothetical protein